MTNEKLYFSIEPDTDELTTQVDEVVAEFRRIRDAIVEVNDALERLNEKGDIELDIQIVADTPDDG